MDVRKITDEVSVAPQIQPADVAGIAAAGFRAIICNRPDGEGADQPTFEEIEAEAEKHGVKVTYLPIVSGSVRDEDATAFGAAMTALPGPVLAYCRTGTRSATLWSLSQADRRPLAEILAAAKAAGYDMNGVARRIANGGRTPTDRADARFDVVIVGGGAAGIATAASLKARRPGLSVAVIDPADVHYYQPGWTMVGAGVFDPATTVRPMGALVPKGVHWLKSAVAAFEPENDVVILDGCRVVGYNRLIVCPGLKLAWNAVEGLVQTLGKNGVTSNYRYDLASYTWALVQKLRSGRALFTQPPMPIKCPGAPQKALYLSADYWLKTGRLKHIDVAFMNAADALFGVKDYVPALMKYVARYEAQLDFCHNLTAIDGTAGKAWFDVHEPGAPPHTVEAEFDMIHVCPPQTAPDFVRVSPLADADGWVDVDQTTLRHKTYDNIWALGDVMNAPNAKTAAAARMQAVIVAENVVADLRDSAPVAAYNGYGSCPLTVERGKIVLAEFGYGGTRLPSFPDWIIDGTKPSRAAWILKEQILPPVYWKAMLKGREWMIKPEKVVAPAADT
ncbi:MAG: TIGR01244 family sulfur transferase [Pseudomonadota bacterium]